MRTLSILLLSLVVHSTIHAQLCKPRHSFYFNLAKFQLTREMSKELEAEIEEMNKFDEIIIEIYGYTDPTGSNELNVKLAQSRANTIREYIQKQYKGKLNSVKTFAKSSEAPSYKIDLPGSNDQYLRRVDLIYYPVKDGIIILKGEKDSEIGAPVTLFDKCGICESGSEINTIGTEDDANQAGIPLITDRGEQLITGGMVSFTSKCDVDSNECFEVRIRMRPTATDTAMKVWESFDTLQTIRWRQRSYSLELTADGFYEMVIPCFIPGVFYNCDRILPDFFPGGCYKIESGYKFKSLTIRDSTGAKIRHDLDSDENISMEDSLLIMAYSGCNDSLVTIYHACITEGINFTYQGKIEPYRVKNVSRYMIPKEAYKSTILFADTTLIVKVPGKHALEPQILVPLIDSTVTMEPYKSSKRKHSLPLPLAEFRLQLKSHEISKDLEEKDVKTRIKKGARIKVIKVRRKVIKELTSI